MPDIEPEEADGLQDLVSALKSIRNRNKLTIKDNPQYEYEWTLEECILRLRSFRAFCFEVHPDYLDRLLPLCVELEFYLDKKPRDKYLTFNIDKHGKAIIYNKLNIIWQECFCNYTDSKWFYEFITQISNLADKSGSVRKGIERSR